MWVASGEAGRTVMAPSVWVTKMAPGAEWREVAEEGRATLPTCRRAVDLFSSTNTCEAEP